MTQHTASGDGAPSSAPPSIGAHYTDTSTGNQYLSKGTASAADWIKQQRSIAPITTEDPFFDIDPAQSTLYITTLNSNTAPTIGTAAAGTRVDVIMAQNETGYHAVTWPTSIKWRAGTSGEVARHAGRVTVVTLWSLGDGRWLGEARAYGDAIQPLYVVAWKSRDGLIRVRVADSSGDEVVHEGPVTEFGLDGYSEQYAAAAISADCRWVAVTEGGFSNKPLIIWDLRSGKYVKVIVQLVPLDPAGVRLQFHDDYLWGWRDDGFFRVNPYSGAIESVATDAPANPQDWSIAGDHVTLNFNNTTGGAGSQLYPARTYNLATGLLTEVQFPLPDGSLLDTGTAGPPSPYGAAGAYSPDGAYYALCTRMVFGESLEDAVPKTVLTVYEVSTNTIVHTLEIPLTNTYDSIVTWSYNSRYVAVLYGSGDAEETRAAILDVREGTHALVLGEPRPVGRQAVITNDGVLVTSGGRSSGFDASAHAAESGADAVMPGWIRGVAGADSNGFPENTIIAMASNGATAE